MKIQVGTDLGSYTYTASTRTIVISGLGSTTPALGDILAVLHAPTGKVLYQIGVIGLAATWTPAVGGGTLVLNASLGTTGADSDPLCILVNYAQARLFRTQGSFTRAANTTVYTPGQLVAGSAGGLIVLDFSPAIGARSAALQLHDCVITSSNGAAATTLWAAVQLFNNPTIAGQSLADQAAWAPSASELATKWVATFESVVTKLPSGTSAYQVAQLGAVHEVLTDSSGHLYAAIVATNAMTPGSAESLFLSVQGAVLG